MGVKVDCSELKTFSDKIAALNNIQREQFFEIATKEMAGRLLALVIPRTPVGKTRTSEDDKVNYQGGTLRRGWTASTEQAARNETGKDLTACVAGMNVEHTGKGYFRITITNPVKYASYVEKGHRQTPGRYVPAIGKRLKANWVNGQFFLETSENELKAAADGILTPMLEAFLRRAF